MMRWMRRNKKEGDAPQHGSKPTRVWLGGATGFLGSHVAQVLTQRGHDVVAVSRSGGDVWTVPSLQEHPSSLESRPVDITDERAVVESAKGCKAAFLCAGKVSRGNEDVKELHRLHVDGTRAALRGLRSAGVRRVVVASSSGTVAVGTDPNTIYDETAPAPLEYIAAWPYYRTKYYGEKAALEEASDDFEVVVVNPSLLLGPGDVRESSTGDVRRFLERAVLACPAGGLAFVDVRDAAEGMVLAFERGDPGRRYILNAANMTLATFLGRLSRLTGVPAPKLRLPKRNQLALGLFGAYEGALKALGGTPPVDRSSVELGQYFWYCSAERAERELGFTSREPIETLRDTVRDLVERKVVPAPPLKVAAPAAE